MHVLITVSSIKFSMCVCALRVSHNSASFCIEAIYKPITKISYMQKVHIVILNHYYVHKLTISLL